jgi:AcrR family transcriptional regulator
LESRSKSSRPRGRPKLDEAATLHENMLNAALGAFIEHGFEAASMEGIARQAGVAKMTLYRHYETKDQLFVEVARRAQLGVRNSLEKITDTGAPLGQVLREIIEKLYVGYTDPRYLAVSRLVIAEARRFPKLGRAMLNDSKYVAEPLVEYLQHLKDIGQIDIDSAYDAATQISGLASGAGRYAFLTPSRHPSSRKRWVESLVTLFMRAWRVESS